jgi:hypothetical protein
MIAITSPNFVNCPKRKASAYSYSPRAASVEIAFCYYFLHFQLYCCCEHVFQVSFNAESKPERYAWQYPISQRVNYFLFRSISCPSYCRACFDWRISAWKNFGRWSRLYYSISNTYEYRCLMCNQGCWQGIQATGSAGSNALRRYDTSMIPTR